MRTFEWTSPTSLEEAVRLLASANESKTESRPQPLAGGQDLLTLLNEGLAQPSRVVNLKGIPALRGLREESGKLEIGALTTLQELAEAASVRERFPGLAEAALSVGSPQIRNLGTVGGNLCQRPRCWYFRLENVLCLKKGGDVCYAAAGENKYNAIFGKGPSYIVHPSDLAPMLAALEATLVLHGTAGRRTVPIERFFTLPGEGDVTRENVLGPGEIVARVVVPDSPAARRSTYLKFRERESFDFAMAAVAAAVELSTGGRVAAARIVLGGVAPIPWRAREAEDFLRGRVPNEAALARAAELALSGASPLSQNAYKVPLTKTLVRRALLALTTR